MRFALFFILATLFAEPSFAGVIFDQPIDYPGTAPNDSTTLAGLNDHGAIVGNFYDHDTTVNTPFVLDHGSFTAIVAPNFYSTTYGTDINNAGNIVGTYIDSQFIDHGFLDNHGTFTSIDVPGASATFVNGINNHGQIVGAYITGGVRNGYIFDQGVFTTISIPNATVDAFHSNDLGIVVGDYELNNGTGRFGYIWNHGALTTIAFPGAFATIATGINDHGMVVGYYSSTLGSGGFLWTPEGFTSLNDPLGFAQPFDINDHGVMVGILNDASGAEGFKARVVPEPSTSFLMFSGLLLLWGSYQLRGATKGRLLPFS